jgi:hypothetical protein
VLLAIDTRALRASANTLALMTIRKPYMGIRIMEMALIFKNQRPNTWLK